MQDTNEWYELLQYNARLKPRLWRIKVVGDRVIKEQGVDGGKMTRTTDIPGSKGKEGTRSYITPEKQALLIRSRLIKRQRMRGYVERGETPITDINLEGPQPSCLRFSKPVNHVSFEEMGEMIGDPDQLAHALWTLKLNGFCHVITRVANKIYIQTRNKMRDDAAKYPHLVQEMFEFLPHKSVVLAELYMGHGETEADRKAMQAISNSAAKVAISKQKEMGLVQAYVFRIPIWEGIHIEGHMTCEEWIDLLQCLPVTENIYTLESKRMTLARAREELLRISSEGFVAYLPGGILGKASFNFRGTEDRPKFCWKLKRAQVEGGRSGEDDFVAYWDPDRDGMHCTAACHHPSRASVSQSELARRCVLCGKKMAADGTWGSGRLRGKVGSLSLYQEDHNGVTQYISDVSSGLTDGLRKSLADYAKYPLVVQVKYDARGYVRRGDDSNALTNPRFVCIRKDKDEVEITNEDL